MRDINFVSFDKKSTVELFYLRNKKLVISFALLIAFITIILMTFAIYSYITAPLSKFKDIKFTINKDIFKNKFNENDKFYILSNKQSLTINYKEYLDKSSSNLNYIKSFIDTNNIDWVLITDLKTNILAAGAIIDSEVVFSNENTLKYSTFNSPYFLFLNKSQKEVIAKNSLSTPSQDLVDYYTNHDIVEVLLDQRYIDFINKLASNTDLDALIENKYKSLNTGQYVGYTGINPVYEWQIVNQDSTTNTLKNNWGISVNTYNKIPRIDNLSPIYQNLSLISLDSYNLLIKVDKSIDINKINESSIELNSVKPSLTDPNNLVIDTQKEILKIQEKLPVNSDYLLIANQLTKNSDNTSVDNNLYQYLVEVGRNFNSPDYKIYANQYPRLTKNCKTIDPTDYSKTILNCWIETFNENQNNQVQSNSFYNEVYINQKFVQNFFLPQILNPLIFKSSAKTSPQATFLYQLSNPLQANTLVKTLPYFTKVSVDNNFIEFDGSYSFKSEKIDNSNVINFTKGEILIDIKIEENKNQNICSSTLSLNQHDNTTFYTYTPRFEDDKVLYNKALLNIIKSDNNNFKGENNAKISINKPSQVNPNEVKNYKYCFTDDLLSSNYGGRSISISARNQLNSEINESQIQTILKFVDTLLINQ